MFSSFSRDEKPLGSTDTTVKISTTADSKQYGVPVVQKCVSRTVTTRNVVINDRMQCLSGLNRPVERNTCCD